MPLQSSRLSKSFVLSLALGLVAATGLVGCGSSDTDQQSNDPEAQNVLINAQTISSLKAGESYNMDLGDSNVVYRLDYSTGAIDYSRIQVDVGSDTNLALPKEMNFVDLVNHGSDPKPDLLAAVDQRFSVASNPSAFGVLTSEELNQVNKVGYVSHRNGTPTSQPQTTDNCFDVTECCCFNALTGAPWDGTGPEICFDVTIHVCP